MIHTALVAALVGLVLITSANAADPDHLQRLKQTGNECEECDLRGVVLTGANLTDADLTDADLSSANLSGANLIHANLTYANLRNADLRSADLRSADLSGADLSGAKLVDARMNGVILCNTTMPDRTVTYQGC